MKSDYREVLERALSHALDHLENMDSTPVAATASPEKLRQGLTHPLAEEGMGAARVLDELVADARHGILGSAGGRFFGWVIGGSVPAALAADWMTSAWDQNAAMYACAPAEAVIEEICGTWLKDLLGLPSTASFALVTGCQSAHTTCLAAARHALLERRGWDVETQGLSGAPQIRILSGQRHGSIERATRLLGLGTESTVALDQDGAGRVRVESLAGALRDHVGEPMILLLQAGDINTGEYDRFEELIPLAQDQGAWVHVDGAFGLWVACSPRYRNLLDGVEKADSWATDGHKWLNVPYDSGYAFVASESSHRASMSHRASYLSHAEDERDQIDWNPEWSRRGRGVATYAAIRHLGRSGIREIVERTCRLAHALVTRIGALPSSEVLCEPIVNQGLLRFLDPRPEATQADHDRRTDAVIAGILDTGEAFFSGTTWRGKRCMRVSVCGWRTTDGDVDRAVAAARQVLGR